MFNFMKKSSGSNNVANNGSSSGYGSQGSANNHSEEKEQRKKMKKMRKEKEKREKSSFSMSSDDLLRLDEVRKFFFLNYLFKINIFYYFLGEKIIKITYKAQRKTKVA